MTSPTTERELLREAVELLNKANYLNQTFDWQCESVILTGKIAAHLSQPVPKTCECVGVEIGSYSNQVILSPIPLHMVEYKTPQGGALDSICVDACLKDEILDLWSKGITTTGCCCGHNKLPGYIGVTENDIQKMKDMGYVVAPNSLHPDREDSFTPKHTGKTPQGLTWEQCKQRVFDVSPHGSTLEDIADEAAQLYHESNREQRWIPVEERLPDDNTPVLCLHEKGKVRFVGFYAHKHEVEVGYDEDFKSDYCEEKDMQYLIPGWYEEEEQHLSDFDFIYLSRKVKAWQPLPPVPPTD